MANDHPPASQSSVTGPSAAEMRRRWLRWLTLGEILAVVGLSISALTLWNSYDERRRGEAEKAREDKHAVVRARTLLLKAKPDGNGERLLLSALGDQAIESQTIRFPAALGADPVDSSEPRIEESWFADGLKKARRGAGEGAHDRGDAHVPVAILTRFFADGALAEAVGIYDVSYALHGTLLGGSEVRLRGLSFVEHVDAKAAQARIDGLWAERHPKTKQR